MNLHRERGVEASNPDENPEWFPRRYSAALIEGESEPFPQRVRAAEHLWDEDIACHVSDKMVDTHYMYSVRDEQN